MTSPRKQPQAAKRKQSLTPRQERFVQEYLKDLNATQSAIRAGYSKRNADKIGSQLLGKSRVASAIAKGKERLAVKAAVTAEEIVKEMAKIGFANMQDYIRISADGDPYIDLSNLTREQAAALAETTVEDFTEGRGDDARDVRRVRIKFHDKMSALVNLGKHVGLFPDRHEHTGKGGKPIEHKVVVEIVEGVAPT